MCFWFWYLTQVVSYSWLLIRKLHKNWFWTLGTATPVAFFLFFIFTFFICVLYINSCFLSIVPLHTSPTRTTPTSTSFIDHIYTNNPSAVVTIDVSDWSISDHQTEISAAPDLSNCQNQNPKDIHKFPLDLLNILTRMFSLLILSARRLVMYINTRTLTRL